MAVKKHILVSDRVRRVPSAGWSWIDRRFVREHIDTLEREAILLYFFLVAVADKDGLSYYADRSLGARLRLETEAVCRARDQLLDRGLIAYERPLYQVLSMPPPTPPEPRGRVEPELAADILAEIFRRSERRKAAR